MKKRRKTRAERDQKWAEAERAVWERFRPRLDAAQNYADAKKLADETVPPDTPGRTYYSNLATFLDTFAALGGASYEENALYLQLVRRMDRAGELKPGVRERAEAVLRDDMEKKKRG